MKLFDHFIRSIDTFVDEYKSLNLVKAGINGPHHHQETPVRNTCHWALSLCRAYELTGKPEYKEIAIQLGDYLLSEEARPFGSSFHHRNEINVDRCNGLIGQAWAFEALAALTKITGDLKYTFTAEEVFFKHKFNQKLSLWHSLDINGTSLNIDNVFNHQLWFAATASILKGNRRHEILNYTTAFLDALPYNLTIQNTGLIEHNVHRVMRSPKQRFLGFIKHLRNGTLFYRLFKQPLEKVNNESYGKVARENGYHAFNTYALAIFKEEIPEHDFWKSATLGKIINYLETDEYISQLDNSAYGYPYNPPGFEVPYSLYTLADIENEKLLKITDKWINEQFTRCFDFTNNLMLKNCPDPITQAARIYEITRFPKELLLNTEVKQ
ncbi:glycoside hydrolase family protein [Methylosarcina fibrata]|uniref:hypothetical protein n=1 Tax=Methylosarcina fibrata TaxID=105972 RepID=UPI00036ACFBC|nr:hypothetical protein [Methylosarcina fibrata]